MIIAQAPLRVSLFGGGSDLPAYLERNAGAVLSLTIDKRVFIVGHPFTHRRGILLKYSQSEDVSSSSEIKHPIAREVLGRYNIDNVDIAVMSDVPAGTGLGSSSAFTVAFIAFVRHLQGLATSAVDLAQEACEIEIEVLKEPIGYQDQWASAIGGINILRFDQKRVAVQQVPLTQADISTLESNLHLVPVGSTRSASAILAEQSISLSADSRSERLTAKMVALVQQGRQAMMTDMDSLGPLLNETWELKRELAHSVSNAEIDDLYGAGLRNGATGGKLLGAGGGGYMAFYVPSTSHDEFARAFPHCLSFRVSMHGAGIIHES